VTPVSPSRPGVKRFIGIDWNFGALKSASGRYWAWIGLLGTLMALGVVAWLTFVTHGGSVMAQRDGSPWGLWFTNYMYFVGLSAGGLVVYASVHLFGAEQFRPLSRIAVLQAAILVLLALLSVFTDFERPWRFMWFLLTPNPTAPFVYTGSAATIYFLLCCADLWVLITGKGGERLAFTMTLIALPAAIYLHTTTAFVLALNKSRELWNTAAMVPIFLSSATASGIALLIIFAYIIQAVSDIKFKPSMFRSLSTLLATVIIIDLFLLTAEIITIFWPESAQPGHTVRMIAFLTGRYAWAFLPVFILGLSAFILLARRKTRHLPAIQITASIMYVLAIFMKRYALMAMGFSLTPLGQPTQIYFPSLVEVLIASGLVALGLLIVSLAIKVLPLEVPEEEHAHGHAEVPELAPAASSEPALEVEGGSL
jgi:molybdopterin-containing oxidoreductase family membrane subunit